MRRVVVKPLALALLLAGVSFGLGQQPGASPRKVIRVEEEENAKPKKAPAKSKLEEMLAEALKNNPDIRVAVAKAAEADAELNRTRLQVTQKVITLHHALLSQKAAVQYAEKKYERFKALSAQGSIDARLLDEAQEALAAAKAKLAELEAQMPALLGKTFPASDAEGKNAFRLSAAEWLHLQSAVNLGYYPPAEALVLKAQNQLKVQGPLSERMRKALETPIKVNYKDVKFSDVLHELQKTVPGLSFNDATGVRYSVTLRFEEALPVSSILQAVADQAGISFFARDYGILAALNAPPGAVTVQEFLRQKPAEQAKLHNPPAENVEGVIKQVDSSGLVRISIGRDAGLAVGHTLEVFRLSEQPSKSKYLGTIRIVETQPDQCLGQPVGRMAETPKVGDRVASRIVGK
jgi:hypothetical protein